MMTKSQRKMEDNPDFFFEIQPQCPLKLRPTSVSHLVMVAKLALDMSERGTFQPQLVLS
jgi:hypothetical protein